MTDKAHPMEFYIYPAGDKEFEAGEILFKDGRYFVVLTPSCDFVLRANGKRKADKVLLAETIRFDGLEDFKKFDALNKKVEKNEKELNQYSNLSGRLKQWMSNNAGEKDRYFFLPSTPFIDSLLIDFQIKVMVEYDDLRTFSRVSRLDDPYAQSMTSSFVRFYNRIGSPDLDVEYVFSSLK